MKRTKYNARKTNGYDSAKEAKRAEVLKLMQENGYISELKEQVVFKLLPRQDVIGIKGKMICGRREMVYKADFTYIDNVAGCYVVEDSKGFKTKEYKRKRRLMELIYGIKIKET